MHFGFEPFLLFHLTVADNLLGLTQSDTIIYYTQIKTLNLTKLHNGIRMRDILQHTILILVNPVLIFCADPLI